MIAEPTCAGLRSAIGTNYRHPSEHALLNCSGFDIQSPPRRRVHRRAGDDAVERDDDPRRIAEQQVEYLKQAGVERVTRRVARPTACSPATLNPRRQSQP